MRTRKIIQMGHKEQSESKRIKIFITHRPRTMMSSMISFGDMHKHYKHN